LAAGLAELLAGFEVRTFPEGTRTAEDAARAVGCSLGQIVKSLVFTAAGRPVVALVSGVNRLDTDVLGRLAGQPVAKVDAGAARAATGYSIGGVPPFGHSTQLPVFVDRDLLGYEVVWAAAGRPDSVFAIAPARLVELSSGSVADLKVAGAGSVGIPKPAAAGPADLSPKDGLLKEDR
jgi:prolyl-tRNA editing enzyme YbaK/EbsC (Cys-tRNA(Pro) deacylase)